MKKYDYNNIAPDIESGNIKKRSISVLNRYLAILCNCPDRNARTDNLIMGITLLNEQNRRTQKWIIGLTIITAIFGVIQTITSYLSYEIASREKQEILIKQQAPAMVLPKIAPKEIQKPSQPTQKTDATLKDSALTNASSPNPPFKWDGKAAP